MGKVNWYIITGIVGLFGVLITVPQTFIGQITLGIVSTQIYEWFAGETIWQTLWNNLCSFRGLQKKVLTVII